MSPVYEEEETSISVLFLFVQECRYGGTLSIRQHVDGANFVPRGIFYHARFRKYKALIFFIPFILRKITCFFARDVILQMSLEFYI